jgi:hypothetical protein
MAGRLQVWWPSVGVVTWAIALAPAAAECVTPARLTQNAAAVAGDWNTTLPESPTPSKFILEIIKKTLDSDKSPAYLHLNQPADKPAVDDQLKSLQDQKKAWQAVPISVEGEDEGQKKTRLQQTFQRVQQWANDGEIVIAIWKGEGPARISIVVPLSEGQTAATSDAEHWKDIPLPRVSHAVEGSASPKAFATASIKESLSDAAKPEEVHFFRYRL